MTKEQLDKAKAIAKDPSKTADTVILPVDKGAAVLDRRQGSGALRQTARPAKNAVVNANRPATSGFRPPTPRAQRAGAAEGKARRRPSSWKAITSQQGERVDRRPQYERRTAYVNGTA